MPTSVVIALIQIVPSILWISLVVSLVVLFRRAVQSDLLPRISEFSIFGVEAKFVREELDRAIGRRAVQVSAGDRDRALRRLSRHRDVFRGARLLWFDEGCDHDANELTMLRSSGVVIEPACSIDDAVRMLGEEKFDAVVCVDGGCNPATEAALLAGMRAQGIERPVILYACGAGPEEGTPARASHVAVRPDELLHCLSDTLERTRL